MWLIGLRRRRNRGRRGRKRGGVNRLGIFRRRRRDEPTFPTKKIPRRKVASIDLRESTLR